MIARLGRKLSSEVFGQAHRRFLTLLALLVAVPAHASHYLVDPAGGGDFTTIQAALATQAGAPRDTVLVLPGTYNESISASLIASLSQPCFIFASGGEAVTTITGGMGPAGGYYDEEIVATFSGFTFTSAITLPSGVACDQCTFESSFSDDKGCSPAHVNNCTFHAPAFLTSDSVGPPFSGLHFIQALLTTEIEGCGGVAFSNCTFEGPGGTLATGSGDATDYVSFSNCRFSNADFGVIGPCLFDNCQFENIGSVAVSDSFSSMRSGFGNDYILTVSGCRFDHCGTALRILGTVRVFGSADTVTDCTGDGVVLTATLELAWPSPTTLNRWIVSRCQGNGIHVVNGARNPGVEFDSVLVTGCGGDGIRIDPPADTTTVFPHSLLVGCESDRNGGDGFHLSWPSLSTIGCVAIGNAHSGFEDFVMSASWPGTQDSLVTNTSVQNGGDGFLVTGVPGVARLVAQNVSALNLGAGFHVPAFVGSLRANDSWQNYGGPFTQGPANADTNLIADPEFCSAATGNFMLQSGSPCSPSGVYGLIGALPVGCANETGVGTSSVPTTFAVRPNPAHGAVEFALPSLVGASRLEIIDLRGRVRWASPLAPNAQVVRWDGRTTEGSLRPGLYWARLASAGPPLVRAFVWTR